MDEEWLQSINPSTRYLNPFCLDMFTHDVQHRTDRNHQCANSFRCTIDYVYCSNYASAPTQVGTLRIYL